MKKSILFLAVNGLVTLNLFSQSTSPAPYCAATYDDGFMSVDHHIANVSIGTLVNNSGSTQYPGGHYVYYNNLPAPTLTKGNTYTLSVTHDGGASIHFLVAYIDFNNDGDFNDAGERVLQKTINDPNTIPNPATVSIVIPTAATVGTTRMRVMVFEDDEYTWENNNTNATPCTADASGFLDWGETEDYNINISGTVTGLNYLSDNNINISAYPNPVSESLFIQTKNNHKIQEVIIYNTSGQEIKAPVNHQSDFSKTINFSDVPNGLYFIEVYSEGDVFRLKITK